MVRKTTQQLIDAGLQPRTNGEGSIFKVINHGKERWRATFTLYMVDGKAVQVSGTGATKQEAIRNRDKNQQKRLVELGQLPPSARE